MRTDLAASAKPWKFIVLHEPGWSAGGGHGNNTTVQNDIQPLAVQYGVAIVFGGHNHYYARANVSGVTHLTMGGGGAPLPAVRAPRDPAIRAQAGGGSVCVLAPRLVGRPEPRAWIRAMRTLVTRP